jgi:hypothetical protein
MALGRRTRRSERAKLDATPPWQVDRERDTDVTTGPYDEADTPDDQLERLDLGSLRIPVVTGVEVRVDVSPEGQVVAATLSYGGSEAQVGAFAAPRRTGIWDDIRKEIRGSISAQGGTAQERAGRFGTELVGKVPVQGGFQAARFVGVDGPRWFLRALFTGQAATDPARAAALEDAVRNIVVVRGSAPMPVRDPLPLQLPREVAEQAEQSGQPAAPAGEPARGGRHAAADDEDEDEHEHDFDPDDEVPETVAEAVDEPAVDVPADEPPARPQPGRRRADRRRR